MLINLGLPVDTLIRAKESDLDLFNQCFWYKGSYSGRLLVLPFNYNTKLKIINSITTTNNYRLFYPKLSLEDSFNQFFRDCTFELVNARLPKVKAVEVLKNLHFAVIKNKLLNN